MGLLSRLLGRRLPKAVEEDLAQRIVAPAREIGPGGIPIAPRRISDVADREAHGGLLEAARMGQADDLDMNSAAQAARAQELGFDLERRYFHGTDQDIAAFRPNDGWYGNGTYVTRSPQQADYYTRRSAGQRSGGGESAANIMPLTVRGRFAPREEFEAVNRSLNKDKLKMTSPAVQEELRRRGYDGVNIGGIDDELLVFDPSNLRSVHARFDPRKSDSSDLLAGFALTALGGGGLLSRLRERQSA